MPNDATRLTMTVAELITECDKYLRSLGYGKDSMRMYSKIWNKFASYASVRNQETFTPAFAEHYLSEEYGVTEDTAKTTYQKNLVLAMRRLSDFP